MNYFLVVSMLFTCVNKKSTKSEKFIVKWEHQLFLRCSTEQPGFFSASSLINISNHFVHCISFDLGWMLLSHTICKTGSHLTVCLIFYHDCITQQMRNVCWKTLSTCQTATPNFSRIFHLLVTWGCCAEVKRSSGEPASSNWVMAEASSASSLDEFEASLSLATTTQRMAAMEIKAVANKTKPSMGLDHGQKCEWSPSLLPHLETRGTSRFRVYFGENTTLLSSRRGNSRGQ